MWPIAVNDACSMYGLSVCVLVMIMRTAQSVARASISQDFWALGSRGGPPVGSLGDKVPQKLKFFL